MGNFEGGLAHLERARDIYKSLIEDDNPIWATLFFALGYTHRQKANYAEAEPLLRRALAIEEQHSGAASSGVRSIARLLADVLSAAKHKKEANALRAKYDKGRPAAKLPPIVSFTDLQRGR